MKGLGVGMRVGQLMLLKSISNYLIGTHPLSSGMCWPPSENAP